MITIKLVVSKLALFGGELPREVGDDVGDDEVGDSVLESIGLVVGESVKL